MRGLVPALALFPCLLWTLASGLTACDRRPAQDGDAAGSGPPASGAAAASATVATSAAATGSGAAPAGCEGCRHNLGVHLQAGCIRMRDGHGGYVLGALPTAVPSHDAIETCPSACCGPPPPPLPGSRPTP